MITDLVLDLLVMYLVIQVHLVVKHLACRHCFYVSKDTSLSYVIISSINFYLNSIFIGFDLELLVV